MNNLPRVDYPVAMSGPSIDPPEAFLEPAINSFATMGLWINGGGSRITGLGIGGFSGSGMEAGLLLSNNGGDTVQDCYLGYGGDQGFASPLPNDVGLMIASDAPNNRIGGTMTGAPVSNVIANNAGPGMIIQSGRNRIIGDFIGTDEQDDSGLGNSDGIVIESDLNTIGGTVATERNLISGNFGAGLNLRGATRNLIEGNYIGTTQDGNQSLPNQGVGILISGNTTSSTCNLDPVGNTIGGTFGTPAGNLISGNAGSGMLLSLSDCDIIQGNVIGLDSTGTVAVPNGQDGISISTGNFNMIGGTSADDGNVISGNNGDGVGIAGTSDAILGNAIFGNAGFNIALANGANNHQWPPLLATATSDQTQTTISGTLLSGPDTSFLIQFFSSSTASSPGSEQFLGSAFVTTDDSGQADFTVTLMVGVSQDQFITATATDPSNNTSQFSPSVPVGPAGP